MISYLGIYAERHIMIIDLKRSKEVSNSLSSAGKVYQRDLEKLILEVLDFKGIFYQHLEFRI